MSARAALALIALVVAGLVVGAGCGSDGGETAVAPVPEDADAPATGTLRFFAYGDTMTEEMLAPFLEAHEDIGDQAGGGGEHLGA